jgi:hypothetical protein
MVFEVIDTYNRVKAELAAQTEQIGKDIGTSIISGSTEQLQSERAAVLKGLQDLYKIPDMGIITGDSKDALMAQLKAIDAEIAKRGPSTGAAVGANLKEGRGAVAAGAEEMVKPIPAKIRSADVEARLAAGEIPGNIGSAILEKQGLVGQAMQALKAQASSELMGWQQAARTIGQLVSTEVAKGVNDKRPGVKAAALNVRTIGEAELRKYIQAGHKVGSDAIAQVAAGMKDKDPAVRAQSRRTMDIIRNTKPNTRPAGVAAGQGVVTGLNSQKGAVGNAAANLARVVSQRIIATILRANPQRKGEQAGNAGGGPVHPPGMASGGVPTVPFAYKVNEKGEELFVPAVRGRILTAQESRAIASVRSMPGGGGDTVVNLSTYGLPMQADTPLEVARQVRRVTTGVIRPFRKRGWSGA